MSVEEEADLNPEGISEHPFWVRHSTSFRGRCKEILLLRSYSSFLFLLLF